MTRTVRHRGKLLVVMAFVTAMMPMATVSAAPASVSMTGPSTAESGLNVEISFKLTNTGDNASAYILDISVPDTWTVTGHLDDGGTWKASENSWLWQTVTPGESVTSSVTLQVSSEASGDYTLSATAKDSDGIVGSDSITVTVGTMTSTPRATPTPTPTDTSTSTPTPTHTAIPTTTPTNIPVQDTDGDGVVDSEDYAPRDPGVRYKSDIEEDGGGGGIPGLSAITALTSLSLVVVVRAIRN